MSTASDARFWDRISRKYAQDAIADQAGYERTLARTRERLPPDSRVLELGCGTGSTALRLADAYGSNGLVTPDPQRATGYALQAAKAGNPTAQKELGDRFASGDGVPQDPDEARRWYEAALASDPALVVEIARTFLAANGPVGSPERGIEILRTAADAGNAAAAAELANAYSKGSAVAPDPAEAMRWYRRAADLGDAHARLVLGHLYLAGDGVPRDKARAIELYREAAEAGVAQAMTALGDLYAIGDGVPQDPDAAARWYAAAAEPASTNRAVPDDRRP